MRDEAEPRSQGHQVQVMAAVAQARERLRIALTRPDALLHELAVVVADLVEAPVVVALLEPAWEGGNRLVRRATTGASGVAVGTPVLTDGTVCGEALLAGRAVRVPDMADAPDTVHAAACCPGARSLLSVPLLDGPLVVGVVSALSERPDWFDRMDERAVALVVQIAGPQLAALPPYPFGADRPGAGGRPPAPAVPAATPGPPAATPGRPVAHPDPEAHPGGMTVSTARRRPPGDHQCEPVRHAVDRVAVLPPPPAPTPPSALSSTLTPAPRPPSGLDPQATQAPDPVLRRGLAGLGGAPQVPGLGVFEWRPASSRLAWSRELYRILGIDPSVRATPALCRDLVHPEDAGVAEALLTLVRRAAQGAEAAGAEAFRVVGPDGAVRHLQTWAAAAIDETGDLVVHGAAVDVTRQARDRLLLERLSATDAVTGLGNRLAFDRRMQERLAAGGDVALILLDLDRFKLVNDSLGHQVGDRLLVEVARRLTGVVPQGSITARMGGDEFVVVPPREVEWLQVRRLAQALVDTLRSPYVLPESGEILVCPASIGLTSSAGREVTADALLSEADLALYRAKDNGRDRYVVYDDALRARARSRHRAELLLRSALEQDRLKLQYQPIVDFHHGRIVGAEALVRVLDDGGERLIAPDAFIEVAEDTGLVVELDLWVIDAAVAQLACWLAGAVSGDAVPWVAVNVSARSMEHPRVVRRLLDGMHRHRIGTDHLKVELTEHSFLGTLPGGEGTLRQLLSSGVPVGIDDFGTGYSAMAYLNRFDLDFMKIDRSFVAKVGEEDRADAVVTAIVDLAHAHGMYVTAEGVETQRQARRLREIGCDFAQGYHFGRPVDAARLLRV